MKARDLAPAVRRVNLPALRCECQRCGHVSHVILVKGGAGDPWKRCPSCKSPYWMTRPGQTRLGRRPGAKIGS